MAVQILYAKETGKELAFGNLDDTINMTDYLREVIEKMFVEKEYTEDDEGITYKVVEYKNIGKLVEVSRASEEEILGELKDVRGNEKRTELVLKMKDLSLLNHVIFKALLQDCEDSAKVVALL